MTAAAAPLLEVRDLRVALPAGSARGHALQGLSIILGRGQTLGVVGASGAGKSTLALSLLGLLPRALRVSAGKVLLEGEDLLRATPARLRALRAARMSMLFAQPAAALDPLMTCGEQIDELLQRRTRLTRSQRRDKTLALLEEAQASEPARIAASLPQGIAVSERQRVLIAMALALDPALLVADEPTHSLDPADQAQILALLREASRRRGMALLFTSRDIGVAADVAQRLVVLHEGVLVEAGPREELQQHARHEVTQHLLAAFAAPPPERAPEPHAALVLGVQDLSKSYRQRLAFAERREAQAVRGVSFEVRRGQTLAVVGATGAGKSTLARCVVRLETPTAGSIRLGQDEIARVGASHLRPLRRRMQWLSDDAPHALDARRTIVDSMLEGPLNFGMPRELARERAKDLLEMVHLPARWLDRHPDRLDGADRQRVCIARALMVEPELIVADDVARPFDPDVQALLLELLDQLQRRLRFAMLFCTRELRAAVRVCDQLAVMHEGELVEQGPLRRVLDAPQHACTRALIAAAPDAGLAFAR